MLKCNSCGATYAENAPGTVTYFHVCPTEIIDQYAKCNPKTGEVVTPATFKPTPNPRNENLVPYETTDDQEKPTIKYRMISEGSGVTKV